MLYISVCTAFLWWTYVDKKNALNEYDRINMPLLDVDINDERAFLIYSIISTVLTVSGFNQTFIS